MPARLLALCLLMLGACASFDDPEFDVDSEPALLEDVCACETEACVEQYVRDVYGCDICVTWQCDTTMLHSCAMCDGSNPDAPLSPTVDYDAPSADTFTE